MVRPRQLMSSTLWPCFSLWEKLEADKEKQPLNPKFRNIKTLGRGWPLAP
jgi:hypothetical protein